MVDVKYITVDFPTGLATLSGRFRLV